MQSVVGRVLDSSPFKCNFCHQLINLNKQLRPKSGSKLFDTEGISEKVNP